MARIIICDDAMFVRETLIQILENEGHQIVATAGNGKECIENYRLYQPDIVLMDITMPDMDGIEATKNILEFDPKAKVIMVSAMGQREKVVEAISVGAKDFIVKPFQAEKIVKCVKRYL